LQSEGERISQINKAEGEAKAITTIADATAAAVRTVAAAMNEPGGMNAANLKVAEQYITAFAGMAKTNNTMIVPGNVADVATAVIIAARVGDVTETASAIPETGSATRSPRR